MKRLLPLLILLSGCAGTPPEENLLLSDRVLNIAHRGGAKLAPEATLQAFAKAVEVGADVLELDVHSTSDGAIVVCHDATVDRTTNGKGRIRDMTLAELKKLDAGQGQRIPTLVELLRAHPDQYFVIEIKQTDPPIVEDVLSILRTEGMGKQVLLASKNDKTLAEIRKSAPDILTGFATFEVMRFLTLKTEEGYEPPGDILQLPLTFTGPEVIDRAHRLGIKVHVWTVNSPREMRALIEQGVDGIITDNPELLGKILLGRP